MLKISTFKATRSVLAAALLGTAFAAPAVAQELSDKSVKTFMDYAWSLVPAQFTKPSGEVIQVDKKKRDEVMVPPDIAREVIRVGRISAHAQVCNLYEDQVANYRSLMKREDNKKQWTPQQMIYISQLHLTTVMLLTGKIKLVEKQGDKQVVIEERKPTVQTCPPEQAAKVKEVIAEYVKAGPPISLATPVPVKPEDGATQPASETTLDVPKK
ncbi:MAG: hypothetical protein KDJ37_01400 [Hyphomicrobiaceae bacterium]|nr:hypothetical protein [Hyphomicrobiaceae bacterium]